MAIVIDVLVIVRALPEADVVDDQLQVALDRFSDRLEGLPLAVDMLIDDDLFSAHLFILEGFPHRIDPCCRRDLHLETRKALSHEVDKVRNADRDRIGTGAIDPFEKVNQLSVAFSRILKVSKTRGV